MTDINDIKGSGKYFIRKSGNTQALGARTISVPADAFKHQITLGAFVGSVTAGTAAVSVKTRGATTFETVQQGSIDFTAPLTLIFYGYLDEIKITPTSFDGTSYVITAVGGP